MNLTSGVQVAQLALKHRQNKHQRQRIVLFAGRLVFSVVHINKGVGNKILAGFWLGLLTRLLRGIDLDLQFKNTCTQTCCLSENNLLVCKRSKLFSSYHYRGNALYLDSFVYFVELGALKDMFFVQPCSGRKEVA